MAKCPTCLKSWWFSREVKCDCAKPKRMVDTQQSRIYMNLKTGDDSTQHYDDATFKRLFLNDFSASESKESHQPSHQDKSNHCSPNPVHSHTSDHSHSSCNSSFGSSDYGSSSGSDYSSSSSSSSDY